LLAYGYFTNSRKNLLKFDYLDKYSSTQDKNSESCEVTEIRC